MIFIVAVKFGVQSSSVPMLICSAYSLNDLKGDQLMEVFVAFLEATAATFPGLQGVFNYSSDATKRNASGSLDLATPFRKLLASMNQNPNHAIADIEGADVLNTEFEYHNAKSHSGGNTKASDAANSLLDQLEETGSDNGGDGNDNRPRAIVEGETGLGDEEKDNTSGDAHDRKSVSLDQQETIDNYVKDVSDDNDNNLDDGDGDHGSEPERPAKRQKIGSLSFHFRRSS
jgi:hypothetical protein